MTQHTAAMVEWNVFRPSQGTGGAAAYDYGSDQPQLISRVAGGGTLWLITSRRRGKSPRQYHLAYKLVNCTQVEPHQSIFSGRWKYVVRAMDWEHSRHFKYNDATGTLRRLCFTSGKPMAEVQNMGLRLLSIPALTEEDVELLERLQHKIENGRAVFISYAHADAAYASALEEGLSQRDVSTSRDVSFLQPGQEWKAALEREVTGTDCFLVLVSAESGERDWVHREVDWAIKEYDAGGLVKAIVPVLLPSGGWDKFPELHRFQRWSWQYPSQEDHAAGFDRLAEGIVAARK